jgi:hypothetical protein
MTGSNCTTPFKAELSVVFIPIQTSFVAMWILVLIQLYRKTHRFVQIKALESAKLSTNSCSSGWHRFVSFLCSCPCSRNTVKMTGFHDTVAILLTLTSIIRINLFFWQSHYGMFPSPFCLENPIIDELLVWIPVSSLMMCACELLSLFIGLTLYPMQENPVKHKMRVFIVVFMIGLFVIIFVSEAFLVDLFDGSQSKLSLIWSLWVFVWIAAMTIYYLFLAQKLLAILNSSNTKGLRNKRIFKLSALIGSSSIVTLITLVSASVLNAYDCPWAWY